jgi:hypothetical protein
MAVPWVQILRWAPQIIGLSSDLLQRSRRTPPAAPPAHLHDRSDLEERLVALEENERRQAELIERMAEQQALLSRAVLALHRRENVLIGALVVLAALLAWQFFR